MAEVRLTAIDPVGMTVQGAGRDAPRRQYQGGNQRPKSPGKRLIAAALPGHDPERYEVLYVLADDGSLSQLLIREVANGNEVARLLPADLARLYKEADPGGLLFESRG